MKRVDLPYKGSAREAFRRRQRPWWGLGFVCRGHDAGGVDGRGYIWQIGDTQYVIAHDGEHDNVVRGAPPIPNRFPITIPAGSIIDLTCTFRDPHDD